MAGIAANTRYCDPLLETMPRSGSERYMEWKSQRAMVGAEMTSLPILMLPIK